MMLPDRSADIARQAWGDRDRRPAALLPFVDVCGLEAKTPRIRYPLVGTGIARRDPSGLDDVLQAAEP
jgi:hypothetical protein